MPQHTSPFLPGAIYHVYNSANGSDDIFHEEDNYRYFEEKYLKYMVDVVDTLAYCWMKNHFHLMMRVKEGDELLKLGDKKSVTNPTGFQNLSGLVSQRFSNLFNAYTKAFNKVYHRRGNLFNRPVKRKQITNKAYFTQCIIYVHQNPCRHGFVNDLLDWKHSSYWGIVEKNDPIVKIEEVLDWFGGVDPFISAHAKYQALQSTFE
jgi:REP element-mobilizing transposase RayT